MKSRRTIRKLYAIVEGNTVELVGHFPMASKICWVPYMGYFTLGLDLFSSEQAAINAAIKQLVEAIAERQKRLVALQAKLKSL